MKIPPPVFALIGALTLVACNELVPELNVAIPYHWWIGGAVFGLGLVIDLSSVRLFGRIGTTVNPMKVEQASHLVTTGMFAFSRNPMYLGMAVVLTGLGIGLQTPVTPLVVAAFVMCINRFQIAHEEPAMETLFGAEYTAYKARVRRWI